MAWAMSRQDMGMYGGNMSGPSADHQSLLASTHQLMMMYDELMRKHLEFAANHQKALAALPLGGQRRKKKGTKTGAPASNMGKAAAACLGVIRLDYDYPPAPGDIDSPESYGYDVFYRVVPGLTFAMCQSGRMTPKVEKEFCDGIDWLVAKGVSGITGDCGFMMFFQQLARRNTTIPVFMSSLAQLPAVTCAYNKNELICIVTANSKTLDPMKDLIRDECGVDPDERRFVILGAQDVPGFEAVALGEKVDVERVTPGMVKLVKDELIKYPKIRAFLFECTELPPYSDAVRAATRLPVYDAITGCDFFISGKQDNERFGLQGWQAAWDGKQADYKYGQNLTASQRSDLVNKVQDMPLRPESTVP